MTSATRSHVGRLTRTICEAYRSFRHGCLGPTTVESIRLVDEVFDVVVRRVAIESLDVDVENLGTLAVGQVKEEPAFETVDEFSW